MPGRATEKISCSRRHPGFLPARPPRPQASTQTELCWKLRSTQMEPTPGVQFEYVDDANFQASAWADAITAPESGIGVGRGKHYQSASTLIRGLTPNTLYHFRAVGTNEAGSSSTGATFKTFRIHTVVQRPLSKRARAPADRGLAAARLPRL